MNGILADITGGELSQVMGVFVVLLAGFYGFAYKMMHDSRKEREIRDQVFVKSIEANTKATIEMKDFLVSLNGSLKKVVKKKQRETSTK